MKISYNWLKSYIPEIPPADKMWDIFTYHLCEVESVDKLENGDTVFDINILPNRAHDLLSHQGIARELASLLGIPFVDPTVTYKIPVPKATHITIDGYGARRYSVRVVRDVTVGPSPEWVVAHLASIGQRSINNLVDATNIVMFDCGQPTHVFDLDKIRGKVVVREAKKGERMTTLDNKEVTLEESDMVIADDVGVLALAGIKGGKRAEVDVNTKNILLEVGNFFPVRVRKTARRLGIFTDAAKRFENNLSPELCDFAHRELAGLLMEYGFTQFEDIVDEYSCDDFKKKRVLVFSLSKISKLLGREVYVQEIFDILQQYNMTYTEKGGEFKVTVPPLRLDLEIEEDMAEEVARILGYDAISPKAPHMAFTPRLNQTYAHIVWARNKLLNEGYSEVMTYSFAKTGEVEVLASASDKRFLRTNIKAGLAESIKLNQLNLPLLSGKEVKVFEIGTVFHKDKEIVHVCYGDKKHITEMPLEEFCNSASPAAPVQSLLHGQLPQKEVSNQFKMWSLFPFIARDIALWVPESVSGSDVADIIREHMGTLVIKGPELFDTFTKEGRTSYAFHLVFQSFNRTLTDEEVGEVMENIHTALRSNTGWELR